MRIKNKYWYILIAILSILLAYGLWHQAYKEKKIEEKLIYEVNQNKIDTHQVLEIAPSGDSCINNEDIPNAKAILNSSDFENNYIQLVTNKASAKYNFVNEKININDNLLLYFEANSPKPATISVEIGTNKEVFSALLHTNIQNSSYYFPIKEITCLKYLKFDVSDRVTIKNVEILNNYNEEIPQYLSGVFIQKSQYKSIDLQTEAINFLNVDRAQDIICSDTYIFTGSIDTLYIFSKQDKKSPKYISELHGLGTIRRLALYSENIVVVASREYGVFLVDYSNPEEMYICSHIDTLELASGIDISNNYLFIADRYYGIEIFDILNPKSPQFVSSIKSDLESERINCKVYGNYLYAAVWATKKVEIFDISDVSKPNYLGYTDVEGNAYGLDVYNNMLIVATGFHSSNNKHDDINCIGYGLGNGVSIYEINDTNGLLEFKNSIGIDGRYYSIGKDYWNVKVSDGYIYFSDLYNGLYVYSINNTKELRLEYKIVSSDNKQEIDTNNTLYSFDAKKTNLGCISGTAIDDGYLYISDELSGIYSLELNVAKINNEVCNNDKINNLSKDCYEKKYVLDGYSINKCNTDGQAFVIVEQENYLYVGTSNGIMIYNKDLELQNIYKTKSAVRDMRIRDGYIYTAEGLDGISIYKIEGNSVRKISDYFLKENTRSNYCSQIGVSPNGDYIVVVCRLNCTVLLDAKDKNNIKIEKYLNSGATYYRNISQISNRIYVASASGVSELIFDNNSYIYKEINNIDYFYSTGGFTRYDDNNVLAICNKGYQLLDVSNGFENVKASDNIKLPDRILLKGVPTVSENLLVVTYTTGGEITLVDISDINNPIVLGDLLIDGIPDVACIADSGEIYIPLRHEGIMKIEKE